MKKILILKPRGTIVGQPSLERVNAFKEFFISKGIDVKEVEQPATFKEKLYLMKLIKKEEIKNIFISMPQFRNWWLFLLPNLNVILDIRDGWSIAMKSGYGGNVKPSKLKAWLASLIEKFAIKRAVLTVTCTPGLQHYLQYKSKKNVSLILNGVSREDEKLVEKLKPEIEKNENEFVAVCVGQFSEYGKDKAKLVVNKLSRAYLEKNIVLKLVGSNPEKNLWIKEFIVENDLENIRFELLERMNRENMYKVILSSDIGVTIIRDPDYDFGTKVFDYILCGLPIFNYFESSNLFSSFFVSKDCVSLKHDRFKKIQSKEDLLLRVLK